MKEVSFINALFIEESLFVIMAKWRFLKMDIFSFLANILFLLVLVATSCQQTTQIAFPIEQMENPQPNRFIVLPSVDSLVITPNSSTISVPVVTSFFSKKELRSTNAHPNRHQIPKNLTEIIIRDDSVIELPFTPAINRQDSTYRIVDDGDTLLIGRLIKMDDRLMDVGLGKTSVATKPRFKDMARNNIQYLDVEQGMASSYIFSMLEDRKGNLWFGNRFGVSKYDGVNFTHYSKNEEFSWVWCILEDQKGNIWFGTWGGALIKYDGLKFAKYSPHEESNRDFNAIEEDRNGNLWFGVDDGLIKYDGLNFFHYGKEEGFLDIKVNAIIEDGQGQLWIGTEEGVVKFDGRKFIQYTEKSGLSNNSVVSIFEDKKGLLWFGTQFGGVNKYNGNAFVHYTTKEGLSHNAVRVILEDNAGNIWFMTDGGGANLFTGESFIQYGEEEGLYVDIYASTKDSSGNIWFGTNGGGVSKFSPKSFSHFSETDGLVNSYVYAIEEDRNGNLWFGTDHGVNKYDGQNLIGFLTDDITVEAIYEDTKGNIWFGTIERGLIMFNGSTLFQYDNIDELVTNRILDISEDKNGNLWIGTDGGGVIKYDGTSFTQFTKENGLSDDQVNVIMEDSQGNLWFGTGRGLSKYDSYRFINYTAEGGFQLGGVSAMTEDKKGNLWFGSIDNGVCMYDGSSFMRFTEREGLSDDITRAILVDHNGHIWVATEKGLNQIIPNTDKSLNRDKGLAAYKIITYETGDGLKAQDFFSSSIFLDRKNQLWLGGGKCLSMIDLNTHEAPSAVPNVFVRSLDINEEVIDYKKTVLNNENGIAYNSVQTFENLPEDLRLSFNKNHLTFHFAAIDWKAPHGLQYSYILDGLNDRWSPANYDTKADYRNVPPGQYTFRVRARGKSLLWSDEASISFVITPPWYQTTWARALFVILGLALVGIVFLLRERSTRIVRQKLEQMVDEKTVLLQAEKREVTNQLAQKEMLMQEVHHRIKNNLTFLKSLLYLRSNATDDSDVKMILNECQARIQSMALVHQNLYDVDDSTEVDFRTFLMELFMALESMFDERHTNILMDIDASDVKIDMKLSVFLGLILNEMITNSFKYAFDGIKDKRIEVLLSDEGSVWSLSYSDNGVGLPDGFDILKTTGFGFKLIKILLSQINAEMTYIQNGLNTFIITIPK